MAVLKSTVALAMMKLLHLSFVKNCLSLQSIQTQTRPSRWLGTHSSSAIARHFSSSNGDRNSGNSEENPNKRQQVESLLSTVMNRAETTISYIESNNPPTLETSKRIPTPNGNPNVSASVASLLLKVVSRAERSMSSQNFSSSTKTEPTSSTGATVVDVEVNVNTPRALDLANSTTDMQELAVEINSNYGRNPAITSTALAHSLWSYVLRPGVDAAIDATAGNGGDALVLAKMLFDGKAKDQNHVESSCQLVCVDVSEQACDNTYRGLAALLPDEVVDKHVQVLHCSHTPLPLPHNATSIGLVVYNLGYLPNLKHTSKTETETTLASIADAARALRIGGLLSIMTYPRSNPEEDAVVRAFLEGMALFSSITKDYKSFIKQLDPGYFGGTEDEETIGHLKKLLIKTLGNVLEKGGKKQTWRVYEHRKIGWTDAPILATAIRIK